MNKLFLPIICSMLIFSQTKYYGSTTAPVTLAGAIVKSQHAETVKKYNRKDCPVCKGKGWYMSGDGILKIECTYCEPDKGDKTSTQKSITFQPKQTECINNQCSPRVIRR